MKFNHHLFGLLLVLWGTLFFSACNSDGSSSDEHEQTERNSANINSSDDPRRGGYYHLSGTLADMTIKMELIDFGNSAIEGHYFRGFYHYDRYGGPISLHGHLDDNGQLVLYEQGGWQDKEHRFEGSWSPQTGFSGKWFNGDGNDEHPFTLKPDKDGALQLSTHHYSDTFKAFPSWEVSPQLIYEVDWITPKANSLPSKQQEFLEHAIKNGILNNNTANEKAPLVPALKDYYTELSSDYMLEMNSLIKEGLLDSQTVNPEGSALDYAYNTSMYIYFNTDSLLTVGYTDYSYTGGAHGMYSTQVASYDLRSLQRLKIADIFLPGYEEKVGEILDNALRLKYGLANDEPLSAILFDNTIMPNDNFGVTSKGIFFVYAPYEIAPYVVGEIELFVAFEKVSDFVREEWYTVVEEKETN